MGRALKSKDKIRLTARCGRKTSGYGELKVNPASTMYNFFISVLCISKFPSNSSAVQDKKKKNRLFTKGNNFQAIMI